MKTVHINLHTEEITFDQTPDISQSSTKKMKRRMTIAPRVSFKNGASISSLDFNMANDLYQTDTNPKMFKSSIYLKMEKMIEHANKYKQDFKGTRIPNFEQKFINNKSQIESNELEAKKLLLKEKLQKKQKRRITLVFNNNKEIKELMKKQTDKSVFSKNGLFQKLKQQNLYDKSIQKLKMVQKEKKFQLALSKKQSIMEKALSQRVSIDNPQLNSPRQINSIKNKNKQNQYTNLPSSKQNSKSKLSHKKTAQNHYQTQNNSPTQKDFYNNLRNMNNLTIQSHLQQQNSKTSSRKSSISAQQQFGNSYYKNLDLSPEQKIQQVLQRHSGRTSSCNNLMDQYDAYDQFKDHYMYLGLMRVKKQNYKHNKKSRCYSSQVDLQLRGAQEICKTASVKQIQRLSQDLSVGKLSYRIL